MEKNKKKIFISSTDIQYFKKTTQKSRDQVFVNNELMEGTCCFLINSALLPGVASLRQLRGYLVGKVLSQVSP